MKFIKQVIFSILAIAGLLYGIMFTLENTHPVNVNMIFFSLPEVSLSIGFFIVLAVGFILGFVLNSIVVISLKSRLFYLKKKVNAAHEEINSLRASSSKELV